MAVTDRKAVRRMEVRTEIEIVAKHKSCTKNTDMSTTFIIIIII